MSTAVDTRKVSDRRSLSFTCLDDIGADVEQLARAPEVRALGNWSAGQVLQHLAIVMNMSVEGPTPQVPWIVRMLVQTFMKKRILTRPMTPGFHLPKTAAILLPPPTEFGQAVENFRQALSRVKTDTRRSAHPVLGMLTREEWDQLHCRHSELHLSFLVPA